MSDPRPNPPAARYLPKRLLPLGIAQSSIILVAIVIFSMEWKNKAQWFHSFLIILSGIHISIVSTIVNNGPDFCNIFKGIVNYIFTTKQNFAALARSCLSSHNLPTSFAPFLASSSVQFSFAILSWKIKLFSYISPMFAEHIPKWG